MSGGGVVGPTYVSLTEHRDTAEMWEIIILCMLFSSPAKNKDKAMPNSNATS